jgi:hypothetical protein
MGFRLMRFAITGVFLVVGLVLWFHGDRLLGGVVALMSMVEDPDACRWRLRGPPAEPVSSGGGS